MARLIRKLTVLAGAAEAARRYARKNPEKVARIAENAGRFVDKKTHGKYHSKIENAVRKVQVQSQGQRPAPAAQRPVPDAQRPVPGAQRPV